MTVADEIIRREAELSPWQEQDELESLYRELGDDEAGRVAVWAAERYEQRDSERERMLEVLIRLACFVPDALIGLHGRLIEAGLMSDFINRYGGQFAVLFASADSETRDRLIAMVDDEDLKHEALWCLAWIGDEVVRERFVTWAWEGVLTTWYALLAGWELLADGDRRFLMVSEGCRRLERAVHPDPVEVMKETEGSCPWCASPLVVLLDLNLGNGRLDFLGVGGERLRVVTCALCTCYTPIFTEVDGQGGARWADVNERPDWLSTGEAGNESQAVRLGLGVARRTPFEAMGFENHMSQLGGLPSWIQNPDYPICPRCHRRMYFLGQVDSGNEFPEWEGMIYAFVDPRCGLAATCYQQT